MTEEQSPPGPGALSKSATTTVIALLFFTLILVVASFPVGLYAIFGGGLATPQLGYGSLVPTFLWVGPVAAAIPFAVPLGWFLLLVLVIYGGFLVLGAAQRTSPVDAAREALQGGIGSLLKSPFIVTLVSIGFLSFTAIIVTAVSQAAAGPVGNPFSNTPPLLELGSLVFSPLREELGFRLVLIGLVAFILSMGKPLKEAARSLWRPSAAYEGALIGGSASVIIWIATAASAVTFGVCHVTCGGGGGGWNWSKFPEAAWGGVVLGYLYVRYGFHVAVLTHWGIDYLGSVFAFYGQAAYGIPVTSTSAEYVGQYLVDIDMLLLFGLASFILVMYLGVKGLLERGRGGEPSLIDKGPPEGGGLEP